MIKFFIDQHGCAKNQVDAEILISRLSALGYAQTLKANEAQIIIVNSCGFIESAKKESLDAVYNARRLYPDAKILLCGCLAQRYANVLKQEMPEADGIFGNGDLSALDGVVKSLVCGNRPVSVPPQSGVCSANRNTLLSFKGSAYLKITEGCDNRCSFCAIPAIRGNLRSRKASEIIEEMECLIKSGIFEVNLIGQDLAAYGTGFDDNVFGNGREYLPHMDKDGHFINKGGQSALSRLLRMISGLSGCFRVRLLYIHPDHFNRDIIPVLKSDSRFLRYFDIPFQSGDDIVLKAMNRTGTRDAYERIVFDIRREFPDAAIRTTFMTGFPGESDEAFIHTQTFMDALQCDWSGCFTYSKEEGTIAYSMKHGVPKKIAKARAKHLEEMQDNITRKRLEMRTGKDYDVLVEELVEGEDGFAIGRAWFQAPDVDGAIVVRYDKKNKAALDTIKPGRVIRVHATGVCGVDIDTVFISDSPLSFSIAPSALRFVSAQDSLDE